MAKRKIFDELVEGVNAMKKHREGKLPLRSYKEEVTPLPAVGSSTKDVGEMGARPGQTETAQGAALVLLLRRVVKIGTTRYCLTELG